MNIRSLLKTAILSLDETALNLFLNSTHEAGTLLSFLFHGLFKNSEELQSGMSDPQQGITVEMFRGFISHFKESGIRSQIGGHLCRIVVAHTSTLQR